MLQHSLLFREECLNVHWFASMEDAQRKIDAFRWDYNENHPHRALKGLSPREYVHRAMATAADSPLWWSEKPGPLTLIPGPPPSDARAVRSLYISRLMRTYVARGLLRRDGIPVLDERDRRGGVVQFCVDEEALVWDYVVLLLAGVCTSVCSRSH
jgi:hypothetical protein